MLHDYDYAFSICIDFKVSNFNWTENLDLSTLCQLYACLANFLIENGATQLINKPSRLFNTLDLILVS